MVQPENRDQVGGCL